ncbi:type I polyketide synthase [Streptomyces olivoverticillatus]|uniref:type I polyketide synthase n=1 Tax=Streptomyces olivoverticillatus TaxID=66427 RepID=UPI00161CD34C|nr:type I polyketide synthase [Streptomyces olivoverticillatus]
MSQHTTAPSEQSEHIAVVGMGCRLPGNVNSPRSLWSLLAEGRDAVGMPPRARTTLWPGLPTPSRGGFLSDVTGFDAEFFGVSGREADVLDPQHRLLLEVAWEALEHAGIVPDLLNGTDTGVFTGLSYTDYMDRLAGHPQELEGSILTNGHCVAAGRISYLLGLRGPCLSLDTACSSSLVAVHLACQALRAGECDLALAGGVSLVLGLRTTRSFARMGMLSSTGRCHTFDAAADGFVRGEGCGIVVLKRLPDAVQDGDRVLAVVRGSAVNQDGRSDGLAAPSAAAQELLFREALARSAVEPHDVGMIETHGTGTPVGDPAEFASLTQVYGSGPGRCALTSLKTNLGHLEPAAGVTGLIKAVLCLRRGMVPPNAHFSRWNPAIHAEGTRFFVPTGLTRWPVGTAPRLAAVSSFGFSGTNAHAVLEQAPSTPARPRVPSPRRTARSTPDVFLMAAGSPAVLPTAARRLADWLEDGGARVPLRDIAHTLAVRRSAGRGRLGVTASRRRELVDALRTFAAGQEHPHVVTGAVGAEVSRRPVWVFSGQGSQWPGMGRGLLESEPAFAAALAEADELIAAESGFSVLEIVRNGTPVSGCGTVQPVLFALQTALAAAWRAHGVEPAGVIGHSMGEVSAAVVAGALSLADGARVICRRSALLSRIAGRGAMATVGLAADAVEAELAGTGSVTVAVLASPESTVVAGDAREVARLLDDWQKRGIPASPVSVDVASHSPQVESLLDELRAACGALESHRPEIPFYSTVLDDPHGVPGFDADYWCANLRRPVRFGPAVAAAAADRHQVFVEIAPHPVVTHSIGQSLTGLVDDPVVLPTLRRDEHEPTAFRRQLAALHCVGVTVDWSTLYEDGNLVEAPTITFDRKHHWVDVPVLPAEAVSGPAPSPLPGQRTEVPGEPLRHCWHGDAGTALLPWLADHRVQGTPVFPGAAHYALALTVACETFDEMPERLEVSDLRFHELLRLTERTEVSTTVTLNTPDSANCEIFGRGANGEWDLLATARLRRLPMPAELHPASVATMAMHHPLALDPADLYRSLRARGLEHGPAFNGIKELRVSSPGDSFWARVHLPETARNPETPFRVHPVLVDQCAQLVIAKLIGDGGDSGLVLPVGMRAVRLLGDPSTAAYCHAQLVDVTEDAVVGQVRLLDEMGKPLLAIDGLQFTRHNAPQVTEADQWFLEAGWHQAPRRASAPSHRPGNLLIIGEGDGSVRPLADALTEAGARSEVWDTALCDGELEECREFFTDRLASLPEAPRAVVTVCGPGPSVDPDGSLRRTRRLLGIAQAVTAAFTDPPRLFTVTRGARVVESGDTVDPGPGALRGLMRVLALEHPGLKATLVDADPADTEWAQVAGELLADGAEDEIALRGDRRYAARLDYAPVTAAERTRAAACTVRHGEDGFRLRVGSSGDLESLELAATGRRRPGVGEVEVRVAAAGLNFRDVLTAMGLLPGDGDIRYRIGFECAGEVAAVGEGVDRLCVGDRVLAIDLRGGAFGSYLTVPEATVARIPASLDAVAAAGIPVAFLTAWYALHHVGRLGRGERVLIHSATGGTGLAAIAVARLLGAEVLATAGSEEKRRYLRALGITQVMDSRSLAFRDEVREATGGEGVDVVLNSLSGAAIQAGLECLRPFGRFVELGVRDIISDTPLGLKPFRHNITMGTVDLIELQQCRPEIFDQLLRDVLTEFSHGRLKPLHCTTFPLSAATDAFRLMAGAGHIGKLVLTVPNSGDASAVLPEGPLTVRRDGAYIITGGLRGVGLETARWLAEQGATHLVLNGRTGPSPETSRVLSELATGGTRVTVVLGDVAEPGTAGRLIAAAGADGLPLRGVVHSAMTLDDAAITNIRDDQLRRVWAPKVTGAWQLHLATAEHSPDWFVVFSSMASLLGNPGQGVYAAANSWLDAFAAWRSARGMPTLAVNWGPWGETGVATGFADRGYRTIRTEEGLRALQALLAHRRVQTGVIPGTPDTWVPVAGRSSSFFQLLLGSTAHPTTVQEDKDDFRSRLAAIPAGPARRNVLEAYVAKHVRTVLRLGGNAIDPQTPLKALGFDSLLAMELRGRLESTLQVKLASNFVWQHPTLAALAEGLAELMGMPMATQ